MALTVQSANAKDQRTAKSGVTLQHRHFAFIAQAISEITEPSLRASIAIHFAGKLKDTNRNFSLSRFYAACNIAAYK